LNTKQDILKSVGTVLIPIDFHCTDK